MTHIFLQTDEKDKLMDLHFLSISLWLGECCLETEIKANCSLAGTTHFRFFSQCGGVVLYLKGNCATLLELIAFFRKLPIRSFVILT